MRRIHASAAVLLGLAIAMLPGAGYAADQPSSVPTEADCGDGASSETVTVFYDGELVTITSDNFGTCLTSASHAVTAQSTLPTAGAPPAVAVPGRPAFTG
jgi:hypothetical protein